MKSLHMAVLGLFLAAGTVGAAPATSVNIDAYVKRDRFESIKISPTGEYYAATVPFDDRTVLAVLRRADNKVTANFRLGKNTHVDGFWWVNDERLVISVAEKFGALDQPLSNGNLYAINADGSRPDILVGWMVNDAGPGTKIKPKKREAIAAALLDDLANDDENVLIAVYPAGPDPYTRAEKMDVYSGRRLTVAKVPVRRARFITDNRGVVRFAIGANSDNASQLFYREKDGGEWELINHESASGRVEVPIGFSADDRTAYLRVQQASGPDAIVAFDVASGTRKEVMRDDDVDPSGIVYRNGTSIPLGAWFADGQPRVEFFDPAAPEARLQRSLEAAFGGDVVQITSQTRDGRLALVQVWSDRNPGDFYIFDTVAKKANHLLSRRDWFDPQAMAQTRPVRFKARDGLPLHGLVTAPAGAGGKLPMVVMVHGGPFEIRDDWGFDSDVQMLANAGYAVLQVNFRGSGGFGRSYIHAGARQWGKAMQDDLTDATRWAIAEGIADAGRVCIYGGSYGAYASLMGVAKEPDLYRCAAGYVGVYDLPTMHTNGDIQRRGSGETYLREWIGERSSLHETSPTKLADRIKVPVFLAAGGEDERAPIAHSRMMESALKKAGVPVETLYYDTEGHGFYVEEHRREYYSRLLAFLSRHLGGRVASTAGGGSEAAK